LVLYTQTTVIPRESRERKEKVKNCCLGHCYHAKGKTIKVLTHQPRYIEPAKVSKLSEGPSSVVEPEHPVSAEARGESAEVPKVMVIVEQEKIVMASVPKRLAKAKEKAIEKPELKKPAGQPKILSPPQEP
jgi:hypothetical protein